MAEKVRRRMALYGVVQGVGFRPFLYNLAASLNLTGWVMNSSTGLTLEIEGSPEDAAEFETRVERDQPVLAEVQARESWLLAPAGFTQFEILESAASDEITAGVLADAATCRDCQAELFDPSNRRFRYPFTNCTHCGPRYTIIHDIPYDRANTVMRDFPLCPDCRAEYEDPTNRRFHAQPNACPVCGPALESTIGDAAAALAARQIVALKGIGGFQLLADARSQGAVARLRQRKHREEKPFALMMPSVEMVREYCEVSPAEQALLESPAAPIVLLTPINRRGIVEKIAENVAQSSPYLGVMLPCSPLHHLLMRAFPHPLVATSGNRSEEPIAIGNDEAQDRLADIADTFVMHDRPIARPVDDSVARVTRGRESVLRRARGYAPLPIRVRRELPAVLAVGGHLKNTVAIAVGKQVIVSQHIGDLETPEARRTFGQTIDDLCRLYRFEPQLVACDLHPDYASTQWAVASGLPVVSIQHHHAHAAACAAENDIQGPYLAVVWDGTGYGLDGTIWGGEFFLADGPNMERIAHLRPWKMPGGEAAVREGWRSAAGLSFEVFGTEKVGMIVARMLEHRINSPVTTSMGRLFDAVASLAGVARENRFEAQAAMKLEWSIGSLVTDEAYPLAGGDWEPMIREIVQDVERGVSTPLISARFHNALVGWIMDVARHSDVRQVALSGGVFQNRYLVERAAAMLESQGFAVYTHQRIPAGDGGIALGQAVLASE